MPKIKSIKVWDADLGNTKPYTIAFKTVDQVRNAFVEITLDNGITGIGSGNPSEYVVGENLSQCLDALQEQNLQFLLGRDITEFNQLTFDVWQKFPKNPSARAALDIALHDVREENDKATDYIHLVNGPEIKDKMMKEYALSEERYYELLARFNERNGDFIYKLETFEVIPLLLQFFADEAKKVKK